MQPTTARDFLRVARQRLDVAAEIMHYLRRNLEAQYIGGYSVECSLKSLILEKNSIGESGSNFAEAHPWSTGPSS